jgi:hypothetical protein
MLTADLLARHRTVAVINPQLILTVLHRWLQCLPTTRICEVIPWLAVDKYLRHRFTVNGEVQIKLLGKKFPI